MAASFPMAAPSWCSRDYCRPSIRLAALMGIRVIFVMTHDSIGLGEDGPTHQPVEHLAALRAIPNLLVFRPADGVETAECWELALRTIPAAPACSPSRARTCPRCATTHTAENLSAKGAYELVGDAERQGHVPRHRLRSRDGGGSARHAGKPRASPRASSPCRAGSCSRNSPKTIVTQVLGPGTVKVAIEAAVRVAGTAISARTAGEAAPSSACTASAPAGRTRTSMQAFRHHRRSRGGRRQGNCSKT